MLTELCQRQTRGRTSWRPAGELFDPRGFEVASIPDDTTARAFVETHHYSGSYVAARRRFGLYERDELVGVAVFSRSYPDVVLRPFGAEGGLELGRFVLVDRVRANGESWFLARALDALRREGFDGIVSFSDPEPRYSADGALTMPGHVGLIYQASNALYQGRATPRTLHQFRDGTVFSGQAAQKIRQRKSGWRYAVEQLVAHGAEEPRDTTPEALRAWMKRELARVARTRRHPGNHRYLVALSRAGRAVLPDGRPYPKFALCGRRAVACETWCAPQLPLFRGAA